jgi:hypothetical protein
VSTSIPDETPVSPSSDWRKTHAFGLPSGSIRALLALAVFGLVWAMLIVRPELEIPGYLRDLLFIIMGHYFASRHRAAITTDSGPPPLFLPNGTIRVLLVIGTAIVAFVLLQKGKIHDIGHNAGVVTLLMVSGFLLGVIANTIYSRWKKQGHHPPRIVEDLRAGISMIAGVLLVVLVLNRLFPTFPVEPIDSLMTRFIPLGKFGPENLLAAIVGFYFGSRS